MIEMALQFLFAIGLFVFILPFLIIGLLLMTKVFGRDH